MVRRTRGRTNFSTAGHLVLSLTLNMGLEGLSWVWWGQTFAP